MPYIICMEVGEDGQPKEGSAGSGGLADRAFHRDELAANPALRVDVEYYLAHQVRSHRTQDTGGHSLTDNHFHAP